MGVAMGTIDLAVEPDFHLGPWLVRPSLGLALRDGAEVRLEPRVLQTLIVLVRAGGRTVSRAELMRTAWGLEVSDDAIGRCIGRLRAVLTVDGVITFETIPKIGYRLIIPDTEQDIVAESKQVDSPATAPDGPAATAPRRPGLLLGAAILALAGVAGLWLALGGPAAAPTATVLPLTSDPGQEMHPAISPGGGQIVYAADRAGQGFDLWLQSLSGGTPVRLTDDRAHDLFPAWSPDGGRIAFIRSEAGKPCRILVRPVPSGPERPVGACTTYRETQPVWLDADHLAFSERAARGEPARIWSLALSGERAGTLVPLTDPPAGQAGDSDPAISPDGRRLAFMRHLGVGVSEVHVRDLATGRETRVTQDGRKLHGVVWSGDGRWLYVSSSRTGDFGLWRFDPDGRQPPQRIAPGLNLLGRVAAGGDRVAAEVRTNRSALLRLEPDGGTSPAIPPSTRLDWDPDVSPDGAIAFASDRTGMFEIWVADPGAAPVPVTQFGGAYTQSPRWAPDGRRLALISTVDGNPGLFILERASGRLTRVAAEPGVEDRAPAWSRDGRRLYFASNRQGDWRIWLSRPPYREAMPITGPGWRAAKESADGKWLYLAHATQRGLWRQPADGGPAEKISEVLDPYDVENWVTGPAGVHLVERVPQQGARILLLPADGGEPRIVAPLPDALYKSSLAIDPEGRLVAGEHQGTMVDIVDIRIAAP
ncbi:winged helix-turn-helix domain-containing protein [Niveispirillum fermenti]|uniref:winged helix-turn-helix domain-containing protein n=1 Tax=Niveispirillum fermenti TaxID=1233113 RepID=UPI003A836CC2